MSKAIEASEIKVGDRIKVTEEFVVDSVRPAGDGNYSYQYTDSDGRQWPFLLTADSKIKLVERQLIPADVNHVVIVDTEDQISFHAARLESGKWFWDGSFEITDEEFEQKVKSKVELGANLTFLAEVSA